MKYLYLILSLLFCSFSSYGQSDEDIENIDAYIANFDYKKALDLINIQEPNRAMLIRKSNCYKALGDYNQSCLVLFNLSQQYPEDKYILTELASTYQYLNNWQQAMSCYDKLVQIDSSNVYFKIKKADMLFNQNKYIESEPLYKSIYLEDNMPSVLKQLGRTYDNLKEIDSAQLYYQKAWQYDFFDTQSLSGYVNMCFKNREFDSAIDACETYIEKGSTNRQINCLLALGYYIKDDYETAVKLFEKCLAQGDSSLIVNRSMGISCYSLNDDRANEFLGRAFAQDTTNNNVLYSLAVTCNDLNKSEEGIMYFSKLLDRTIPKNGALYLYYRGLAIAYLNNDDYEEAIGNYKIAMKYGTPNQSAILNTTIADIYYFKIKNKTEALPYYKQYNLYLSDYIEKLKKKENPDSDDIADIKDAEKRIRELNIFIKSIESAQKAKKEVDKKQPEIINQNQNDSIVEMKITL